MNWTAIVPIKGGRNGKSRLSPRLSVDERILLAGRMAAHVLDCLACVPAIRSVVTLSPARIAALDWRADEGRGLNAELDAFRRDSGGRPLLVIHGDLPLLSPADVEALIAAAQSHGSAIGPDREGRGTNAVALATADRFRFRFGPGSSAAHLLESGGKAAIVNRRGLSHDIDTPADLAFLDALNPARPVAWVESMTG